MLGRPIIIQDGDTPHALNGRFQTTSERGSGLRFLVTNIVSFIGTLTAPRTVTVPDASFTLAGTDIAQTFSAAITSTNGRLIQVRSVVSAAGTTVLDTTDHAAFLTGTTTQTFTLPAAVNGRQLLLKNRSTAALTVNRAGADTIDGLTTLNVAAGAGVILIANATDWGVI